MEKVIQKILDEAMGRVGGIGERVREDALKLLEDAKNEVSRVEENAKKSAYLQGRVEKEKILALFRVEIRKEKLIFKRKLSDEVFEKALETLASETDYKDWMLNLFQQVIESGDEEVIFGIKEKTMDKSFIKELNNKIRKNGKVGNLRFSSERKEISGGFILKSGRVEINASLEALLRNIRDELEVEVGKILFRG